ncbi:ArsR/SmtB family transcription factor [Leifsonia aquatica]|uniref:ArsR/SmtB family transcription factor n=1 Tax=Leifsonia aquatica TaxID=144185 RepID=UPI00384ED887
MSAVKLVPVFAALGDETRWSILGALEGELPVSRQAIAKHLAVLREVGLVEPVRVGREVRFRVLGSELSATARRLDAVGAAWDRRLAEIKRIAEGLSSAARSGAGPREKIQDATSPSRSWVKRRVPSKPMGGSFRRGAPG